MADLIYLDYCATTPVHSEVKKSILETLDCYFGNPSSMHQAGIDAKQLLDNARKKVAAGIGCLPEEVYFTSGATEADNLALFGLMRQYEPGDAHLITSAVEHHAVLHAANQLEREGYEISILPVDNSGVVDPDDVKKEIRPNTRLVSIMHVNNEIGSLQRISEIGNITSTRGILFHTDAVQGVGFFYIDVEELKVDLLSLSAHKIYGPKGIGALFVRRSVGLSPVLHGGSQESGLRPGTENIPGIVGLGKAIEMVLDRRDNEFERLNSLRIWFIEKIFEKIPGISINGGENVSPHILSISFPNAIAEMMQFHLHTQGVAVSLGSACTSKSIEPSHVLKAIGLPTEQIEGTLRISFGYPTTQNELSRVIELIHGIWERSLSHE